MHKNELICQKCAINCGIEGNASNENITKYKNLSGVKSISNSVQWLARYRIVALISIGRLCMNSKKSVNGNFLSSDIFFRLFPCLLNRGYTSYHLLIASG